MTAMQTTIEAQSTVLPFTPAIHTEQDLLLCALQHLQRVMALLAGKECDPTLADVVTVLIEAQHSFGEQAPLEDVIQRLVAQNLTAQLAERRAARTTHHLTH